MTLGRRLYIVSALLAIGWAVASQAAPDRSARKPDGSVAAIPAQPGGPRADSLAVHPATGDSAAGDSLAVWRSWKDISRAIALEPLDGPQDIREKAEIIQDRVDNLRDQAGRIDSSSTAWRRRRDALRTQLGVLEDLGDVGRGSDLQLERRLRDLTGQLDAAEDDVQRLEGLGIELDSLVAHWTGVAAAYGRKAAQLEREEERR